MPKESKEAAEKLKRIEQLWRELEQTKPNTPGYEALLKKIRALSAEYRDLPGAPE
jgi:hypothetical protein